LRRVVPVAQRQADGDVAVAIVSLELYGDGLGVLRWRVSFGDDALRTDPDLGFGIHEPEFEIGDGSGRTLPWWPLNAGAGEREAEGGTGVGNLPDAGELEVEVPRLVADVYGREGEHLGNETTYRGSWSFRFAL
jgi:hypothetical protein